VVPGSAVAAIARRIDGFLDARLCMNPILSRAIAIAACVFSTHAFPEGTSLCSTPPSIDGPVFVSFDASYTVYTWNTTTRPDGTYEFTRHDIANTEIVSICSEGFDLRAVPDQSVQGSYFPTAVEFYHAALDHYFVTANAIEISDLDTGVHPGWTRTGQQFDVYVHDPTPATGNLPLASVCRYYGLPAFGLDTHFYSAFADECDAVMVKWPDRWEPETADAFRVHLPSVDGTCAGGTRPLFRLYNGRADANHRYTTSRAVRDAMIAKGWISEGFGAQGVGMCVRST
jgi:hypothetical protein